MSIQAAKGVARRVGWLAGQPRELQDRILDGCELQFRTTGEHLYSLGDPPGGLHCVVAGSFNVLLAVGPLNPFLAFIARPGWWAGDVAATTRSERRVEVRARGSGAVLYLPAHRLERIGEEDPAFWRRLGALTVAHADNALWFAAASMQRDVRTRVVATLMRLAFDQESLDMEIELDCTQTDLAEMAGLSRNSVGIKLKRLQDEGYLTQRYGKIVFNPLRLRGSLVPKE